MSEEQWLCWFFIAGYCGDMCIDFNSDYLSMEPGGIGRMLVFLAFQGCLYFSLLILLELRLVQTAWYNMTQREAKPGSRRNRYMRLSSVEMVEDGDVTQERLRVNDTPLETLLLTDSLLLQELSKSYGSLQAVDRLSVGIPRGECFGLLGINGAGKTSTFQMLTGDELVSAGNAYLDGFDIKTDMTMVRSDLAAPSTANHHFAAGRKTDRFVNLSYCKYPNTTCSWCTVRQVVFSETNKLAKLFCDRKLKNPNSHKILRQQNLGDLQHMCM